MVIVYEMMGWQGEKITGHRGLLTDALGTGSDEQLIAVAQRFVAAMRAVASAHTAG